MIHQGTIGELDQGMDPWANLFAHTSRGYFNYMLPNGDYGRNEDRDQHSFSDHHNQKEGDVVRAINDFTKHKVCNIVVLGAGLRPLDTDFRSTVQSSIFPRVRNLVLADFSADVLHRTIVETQRSTHLSVAQIYPMVFDITDGYSTALQSLIVNQFSKLTTLEEFVAAAQRLEKLTHDEVEQLLKEHLMNIQSSIDPTIKSTIDDYPFLRFAKRMNTERSLKLSTDSQQLPIDIWHLPMVLSGTGSAAETEFLYPPLQDAFTNSPDDLFKKKKKLEQFEEAYYRFNARYNSIVTRNGVQRILSENPTSLVISPTDVTTVKADFTHDRLHRDWLFTELSNQNIRMRQRKSWKWYDAIDHHHDVLMLEFFKAKKSY